MSEYHNTVLVTGAAGFIGYHTAQRLLNEGYTVVGVDNLNPYYSVQLKTDRIQLLQQHPKFQFLKVSLEDEKGMGAVFKTHAFQAVIHLAAQAGVRYSLKSPHTYIRSNVDGFLNILEGCRHHDVGHLIFASSSSVYGANTRMPFRVQDNVDHPMSLYAATKKSNELMAHAYAHLYDIPTTGLRFFTVYGPWGRPDMALFLFTEKILLNEPIDVYNHGNMRRDFTYVDDIVEAVTRLVRKPASPSTYWSGEEPDPASSFAPYRLYNIGNHSPVALNRFIEIIEDYLGKKAKKNYMPIQPGDVPETYADIANLQQDVDFSPSTPLEVGIPRFIDWYRDYYGK